MPKQAEVVFGTVITCTEESDLIVQMDNGEIGFVNKQEVTRRELKKEPNFHKLVGRRLGFIVGPADEQGQYILSGKAYENQLYEDILRAFHQKERNVYKAHLVSTTQDGKLAFYTLAQGVTGSVSVTDFASTRIRSFHDISLPREMTVAIKEVDSLGRIQLYGKISFPDFLQSVEKLQLEEGSVAEGYVSSFIPSTGDAVVTLAPNLTVLTQRAASGSRVCVKIKRIYADEHCLKAELLSLCPDQYPGFCFNEWCVDASAYPSYMDIESFEERIRKVGKRLPAAKTEETKEEEVIISYQVNAEISPFAIRDNEKAERMPLSGGTAGAILFEVQHGHLTKEHMEVAKAVNTLKFSTAYQLQRFLDCSHELRLSMSKLWNILHRLIKHDIIHAMTLDPGESMTAFKVFYPGAMNYTRYTGEQRSLPTWSYSAEPDASHIKYCLSLNQLLLGLLHGWKNINQCEYRCCLQINDKVLLRPRCKISLKDGGGNIYVESARSNWLEEMLDKLKRYDLYFSEVSEQGPKVIIALEDHAAAEAFAIKVKALCLKYEVLLTSDVECLPSPATISVPAMKVGSKESFFKKLRMVFAEKQVG